VFERVGELAKEHAQLEREMADPAVHSDPDRARALGKRYAELSPVVTAYREWEHIAADELFLQNKQ